LVYSFGTDERHTDIELRVCGPRIRTIAARLPALEHAHGIVVASEVHEHLRFEQMTLRLERARQCTANRGQRFRSLLQVIALIPDFG
jgi:class 3 adenylate cyclase